MVFLAYVWLGFGFVSSFNSPFALIFGLLACFVGIIATTAIHEGGHAIAAWLVGWRVILLSVVWFNWQVPNRDFAFNKAFEKNDVLGKVMAVPASELSATPMRAAMFVAGGPVASLLSAYFLFQAANAFPDIEITGGGSLAKLCEVMGIYSVFVALMTGVPFLALRSNDGTELVEIVRLKQEAAILNSLGWVGGLLKYKVRLRDLPEWMLKLVETKTEGSPEVKKLVESIEIGRLLDREPLDVIEARSRIEAYAVRYGVNAWHAACDAFLAIVHENDPEHGRNALATIALPCDVPALELACRAALARSDAQLNLAEDLLQEMDGVLNKQSIFRDETFIDIRKRVENVAPFRSCQNSGIAAPAG